MGKKPTPISLTPLFVYLGLASIFGAGFLFYDLHQAKSHSVTPRITQETIYTTSRPELISDEVFPEKSDDTERDELISDEVFTEKSDDTERDEPIIANSWHVEEVRESPMIYTFDDSDLGYRVLRRFDAFEPVNETYFENTAEGRSKYDEAWMGTTNNDSYCSMHRAYILENPEFIFEDINFVTDSAPNSLVRKVLSSIGNDIQPNIGSHMRQDKKSQFTHDLNLDANLFFGSEIGQYKHVGKHFSCLSQISHHIPGDTALTRNDLIAENAVEYATQFKGLPQCFSNDKYFPQTWLLDNKESCQDFFNVLNSEEYEVAKEEKNIVFIRTVKGESSVFPVNEDEEESLKTIYKNGDLCGQVSKNYIMQQNIHNPLTLEGRSFDLRMYMLVASTNPLMVYYHDGFLDVSIDNYDPDSTGLDFDDEIYDDAKEGDSSSGVNNKVTQQWSLEEFESQLVESGIVTKTNWLDKYLRPELKKAMAHLAMMSAHSLLERSSVYGLYSVDFLLDENLNLWFVEANSEPVFDGHSKPTERLVEKMLKDHFEIVVGLLRSRMKRIVIYINELLLSGAIREGKYLNTKIDGFNQKVKEFAKIAQNSFEEEFRPSNGNGFAKIVDYNYSGVKRYQKLLPKECLCNM